MKTWRTPMRARPATCGRGCDTLQDSWDQPVASPLGVLTVASEGLAQDRLFDPGAKKLSRDEGHQQGQEYGARHGEDQAGATDDLAEVDRMPDNTVRSRGDHLSRFGHDAEVEAQVEERIHAQAN